MAKLPSVRLSRDTVLFIAGLVGIGNEATSQGTDRPTLLILFGAMVGLPAFLRSDEAKKDKPKDDPPVKDKDATAP